MPSPANRDALRAALDAWLAERSSAPDADVPRIDAEHAGAIGLPTLAALLEAETSLGSDRGAPLTRGEFAAALRAIRQVLVGEATERVRHLLRDSQHPGIPGIGVRPTQGSILETRYGPSGKGRPPKRPGYAAGSRRSA